MQLWFNRVSILNNFYRFTALQHGASGMDSYESAGARPKNNKDQNMRRTAIRGSQEMYSGGASSNTRDKNERSSSPATNGSRNASRDSSVGFDSASSAAGGADKRAGDVPSKSSVALSAQEIERRTKSLLLEYFSVKDLKVFRISTFPIYVLSIFKVFAWSFWWYWSIPAISFELWWGPGSFPHYHLRSWSYISPDLIILYYFQRYILLTSPTD